MDHRPSWIVVAHIVRPQGRRGEVLADVLTDFPERFGERQTLTLVNAKNEAVRQVILTAFWLHKGRVVLKFSGIESISDAEALRGLDVAISFEQRAPLEEGSYYISDLIGCEVWHEGRSIGQIVAVDRETTDAPLLVLKPERSLSSMPSRSDEELLVPFAKAYLRNVDIEGKSIEMKLPEGLLEINAENRKSDGRSDRADSFTKIDSR